MIKIENVDVYGWETAIRGMRNPMNSWDKSDSRYTEEGYRIGYNDLDLMKRLVQAGTDHSKFMRMIMVSMDITAPLYWWKEFDTYKVGTVANSCSTMHKIHAKEFTFDDFSCEHLSWIDIGGGVGSTCHILNNLINALNRCRELYLKTNDKHYWWQMIQLLPSSYNQKRTVLLNYAVLQNIYHARKNHKLDEWREFCKEVRMLPYAGTLIAQDM